MSNFIGLVYATLKNEGIDTKGLSNDEAVKKFNELQGKETTNQKEISTPAEKRRLKQMGITNESDELREKIQNLESKKTPTTKANVVNVMKDTLTGKYLYYDNGYKLSDKPIQYNGNNFFNNKNAYKQLKEDLPDVQSRSRFENTTETIGEKISSDFTQEDEKELSRLKQELNYVEKMKAPITKKDAIELIDYKVQNKFSFSESGSVHDNKNIYTKYDRNKISETIENIFDTSVDFSNLSEATYFTIPTKNDEFKIRIGSHFKSGVSGDSDVSMDYRNYETLTDFKKDLKEIKKIIDNVKE